MSQDFAPTAHIEIQTFALRVNASVHRFVAAGTDADVPEIIDRRRALYLIRAHVDKALAKLDEQLQRRRERGIEP